MFVSRIMAVAAAVAATAPAAVSAAPVSDNGMLTRQVRVQTNDLNLASTAGQNALLRRVRNATTQVCGTADLNNLTDFRAVAHCKQVALTDAKQQVANVIALSTSRYAEAKPAQAPATTASGS